MSTKTDLSNYGLRESLRSHGEPSAVSQTVRNCEHILDAGIKRIESEQANFAKLRAEMRDAIRRSKPQMGQSLLKDNPKEYMRRKAAKAKRRKAFLKAFDAGHGIVKSTAMSGASVSEASYWASKYRNKAAPSPEKDAIIRHAAQFGVPQQFVDHEHGWHKMTAFWTAKRLGIQLDRIHQARDSEMDRANAAAAAAGYKTRCTREGDQWWFVGDTPKTAHHKIRVKVAA